MDLSSQSRYLVKYAELCYCSKNRNCSFCSNEQQRDTHVRHSGLPVKSLPGVPVLKESGLKEE
jgi:hypothetical protein